MAKATPRKTRTPIGDMSRSRLAVRGGDPNFEYRIVNTDPGRVELFQENGWEVVKDEEISIGDRRVATPTSTSSVKEIDVGQGKKAVLMKLPKELWEEDLAFKEKRASEPMQSIRREAKDEGFYGDITSKTT